MKRDFLTNLGLESEQVDKIMAEHGKTVNALKEDADKSAELEKQIEEKDKQLAERDKQLKNLEKSAKGNEDLEQQIKELQEANENTAKEWEEKLAQTKKEAKLELALKDAKAKNPRAVKALLDADTIKLDGDKLLGLEEQLKGLQESDGYLFEATETEQPKPNFTTGQHQKTGVDPQDFSKMSYKDRLQLKKSNPEQYKELAGK